MTTQVGTVGATIEEVMRDPAFQLGAADVRAGLPFRTRRDDGKLSADAIRWFRRMKGIL
jgi:hypothetical protein